MARHPTYDEWKDKPLKGIQRCDDLLKKNPNDAQLLITKLQLQASQQDIEAVNITTTQLQSSQPPIRSLEDVSLVEDNVLQAYRDVYPPLNSAGPEVAKLWDVVCKAASNGNHKLDLLSLRMSRAIIDSRLLDAQQSLIQLKAVAPKNRVFYMAHAAFTQLLSTRKDDLQSKLAFSLARKAVNEKFDDDKALDCRVPGQIFALQGAEKDLKDIEGKAFAESKQVSDALRTSRTAEQSDSTDTTSSASPRDVYLKDTTALQQRFESLVRSDSKQISQFEGLTADAINLFQSATTSSTLASWRPVTTPLFLAISALVKVWTIDHKAKRLVLSAYLAEHLLTLQKDVYEARVILLYLYVRLGLGSLAMKEWDTLSIKEVQYDTFGHTFLTRLSTLHPHNFKDPKGRRLRSVEPIRLLNHALGVYRRCEEKLAETHASVLNHGQTGMIFDLFDMRESLRLSLTRRIIAIEHRRISRVLGKHLDDSSVHIHPQLTAAYHPKDTRDFSTTMHFGFNVERALHDEGPSRTWIAFNLIADALWSLTHEQPPLIKDTANLVEMIGSEPPQERLTDAEFVVGKLILVLLRSTLPGAGISVSDVETALTALHTERLIEAGSTLPLLAQDVFTYLDALRMVRAFCKHAETTQILPKNEASRITQLAETSYKQLQAYAKEQVGCQAYPPIVKSMLDTDESGGVLSRAVASLNGNVKGFCEEIMESVKDTWAGVAQIKYT